MRRDFLTRVSHEVAISLIIHRPKESGSVIRVYFSHNARNFAYEDDSGGEYRAEQDSTGV